MAHNAEKDAGVYEPCVTNSEGNCSRWSHDHGAESDGPMNVPSQPGRGEQKGKTDGEKGGVHPDRARRRAEGARRAGVHGGSGVLDRSGLDPMWAHGVSDRELIHAPAPEGKTSGAGRPAYVLPPAEGDA